MNKNVGNLCFVIHAFYKSIATQQQTNEVIGFSIFPKYSSQSKVGKTSISAAAFYGKINIKEFQIRKKDFFWL